MYQKMSRWNVKFVRLYAGLRYSGKFTYRFLQRRVDTRCLCIALGFPLSWSRRCRIPSCGWKCGRMLQRVKRVSPSSWSRCRFFFLRAATSGRLSIRGCRHLNLLSSCRKARCLLRRSWRGWLLLRRGRLLLCMLSRLLDCRRSMSVIL